MSDEEELYSRFYKRHNIEHALFRDILANTKTDYSNKPIPVLMQPSIIQNMIDMMNEYNDINNTDDGFSFSSILSLVQLKKTTKTDPKYKRELQLDTTSHGKEFLKKIFSMIISSNPRDNSIMNMIEKTQSHFKSRKSDSNNPKLFLIYLPLGNDINRLQETICEFLEKNKLWRNYHVTYSNSKSNSDKDVKKYKEFVDKQMQIAKNKKDCAGCIIFLGNQGKMAYTYHDCDVVIRLDNGTDIDDAEQVGYRCLTEGPITDNVDEQKTIGITVDLNIQRVYAIMRNKIKNYKKDNPGSKKTYGEIIQYMYEENQFIFNPIEIDFGNCSTEMVEYYKSYEDKLKSETLIETVICNIQCEDSLSDYIKKIKSKDGTYQANPKLNGKQPDCPKGGKTKKKVDSIPVDKSKSDKNVDSHEDSDIDVDEPNIFNDINKTKNLYEFLTKLCCLMLRIDYMNKKNSSGVIELLKILKEDEKRFNIIKMKLIDDYDVSDIDINIIYDRYIEDMSNGNNIDILDDIFEIYSNTDPNVVRDIIGKHFIPSLDQKKKNAEIPTPPKLCDEMIDKIPNQHFMNSSNKTCEPCCGKGNFVLAIFERYFNGLSHIEDECERCIYIIENCLYFCDIESINVYITEELLKCHALSKMKQEFWENWDNVIRICNVKFNSHVCNTLELNIQKKWNINGFDAVICNPPYEERDPITGKSKGGGNNMYTKFIYFADKILNQNGYILFINPPTYFSPGRTNNKNDMNLRKDILDKYYYHFINLQECSKYFPGVGSKFIYYLIQKNNDKNKNMNVICKYNDIIYNSTMDQNLIIRDYLSYLLTNECLNILDKIKNNENDKLNIINSTVFDKRRPYVLKKLKKEKNEDYKKRAFSNKYKYPIQATGVQICYASKPCVNQNNKKVLMSRSGYLRPVYDDGILGIGGDCYSCLVKDKKEGNEVIKLLNSKLYKFYIDTNKWSGFHHKDVLQDLPNIIKKINNINDSNIYKYFNLTANEIKLIETLYNN